MSEVEVVLLNATESCTVYSIQLLSENESEFENFYNRFKNIAEFNQDFLQLFSFVKKVLNTGAYERFFRPEGKLRDSICAIPVFKSKLRLYCLRFSDKILVLGNGGVKTTKTYQEDNELAGYVMTLQKFEKFIKESIRTGSVSIREAHIDWDNNNENS